MRATVQFLICRMVEGAGPDDEGEELETELTVEVDVTLGDPTSSDPWDSGEIEVLGVTLAGEPWAGRLTDDELDHLEAECGHLFDDTEGPDWTDYHEPLPEYYDGH